MFDEKVQNDLAGIVVIPSYAEPDILITLQSLLDCKGYSKSVEVIIVVNDTENCSDEIKKYNQKSFESIFDFISKNNSSSLKFLVHYAKNLPSKHGGVGLARKIGMDEALRRALIIGNINLPIICLDADCLVEANYTQEIHDYFFRNPQKTAASIYFEHNTDSESIIYYELFLRYYVSALRFSGFPYAYHTVGSSMAVRAIYYAMEGGMNRKKAGEDFYFLHKIIPKGEFGEINSTKVIPSSRKSQRVPFGTGRAMLEFEQNPHKMTMSYNLQTFIDLKLVFQSVNKWWNLSENENGMRELFTGLPQSFRSFIKWDEFWTQIKEAKENSNSENTFRKRIFQWLNAFTILKYVHHCRENEYLNENLVSSCTELLKEIGLNLPNSEKAIDMLTEFRNLDKHGVLLDQMTKI